MTYLPSYVDYSFDSFDRRALLIGTAAATLGGALLLRKQAFEELDRKGYNLSTLPSSIRENESFVESYANETRNLLAGGVLYIEPSAPYTSGGAVVMAKRTFDQARSLLLQAYVLPRCCGPLFRPFLPGPDAELSLGALALAAVGACALSRGRRRLE